MNWRKFLASKDAGFWLFISLAFFGSMIWAKSRDPFERIWFTVKTSHYGKVKGVAVLPVREKFKVQSPKSKVTQHEDRKHQRTLPVVYYVYGSGGDLINCGNELRQLAELGMAAVAIEYNQTNEAAFDEQFKAVRKWAAGNAELSKRGTRNAERGMQNPECWVGFSLGAERTLRFLLNHPETQPQLYVRLAGGSQPLAELKTENLKLKTHVLLVHGQNDEIFPVAEAKQVAAFFRTNGISTELKILPGKSHAFDADRAVVIRNVGEYIKAQLTPEHPLPEFPVTKDFPFLLCIAPAFAWAAFWFYLRKGSARVPRAVAGVAPDTRSTAVIDAPLQSKLNKWEIALRMTAIILATLAIADTAIHLGTPRFAVNETTLKIARKFLIPPKWKEDFETLAAKSYWRGQRLKTLLTHVELANYCVYELINWKVDKEIYNDYVLSPMIDPDDEGRARHSVRAGTQSAKSGAHGLTRPTVESPGAHGVMHPTAEELDWRRPLWEFFYPRIRKENSPEEAAEIVVRNLRERVTISLQSRTGVPPVQSNPSSSRAGETPTLLSRTGETPALLSVDRMSAAHLSTGIEIIWKNRITDEKGFERIYVATLRSVGVGARLNSEGTAEFWTGAEWKLAPRLLITSWIR